MNRNIGIMSLRIESFTFNPFQENTYIIYNEEKECIIIDPGCSDINENKKLEGFIATHSLQPIQLLNTHCHVDHIFGNKFVQDKWDLPLWIHSGEKTILESSPQIAEVYGMKSPEMVDDIKFLDDLDSINLGKEEFKLIFTPGHSPAHISLYSENNNILISGDVLFRDSIGRTDLPGGNHAQLLDTIKTKLWKLPDKTIVYPGHGPTTTIGYEKENNPFL